MLGPDDLRALRAAQPERFEELVGRYERDLESPDTRPGLSAYLPAPGDPLRLPCLFHLIPVEMGWRQRAGQKVFVDDYLREFPELAAHPDLVTDLILADMRRGASESRLAHYRQHFPDLAELLQQLAEQSSAQRPSAAVPLTRSPNPNPQTFPHQSDPGGTPAVARMAPGEVLATGYRLVAPLGEGAFGTVWRAEAPGGIPVALKVLPRNAAGPKYLERELRALNTIKNLRHPHLSPLLGFWANDTGLVVVSELADGSLRDHGRECRARGLPGIPHDELLRYVGHAALGLDYLHRHGIVHGDVKPANILRVGDVAKLADFSLAMNLSEPQEKLPAGTPGYMAPELWRGERGPAGDLFALAVTYAELRLGRSLFPGSSPEAVMRATLGEPPNLAPLPEAEQAVLRRALSDDPAHRQRDALSLVEHLSASRLQAPGTGAPMASRAPLTADASGSLPPPPGPTGTVAPQVGAAPDYSAPVASWEKTLIPDEPPPPSHPEPPSRPVKAPPGASVLRTAAERLGRLGAWLGRLAKRGRPGDGAASAPLPETIRRHTEITFPARVPARKTRVLRVRLVPAEEVLPGGEVRPVPAPGPHDVTLAIAVPRPPSPDQMPPPVRLAVSVAAENFAVDGEARGELIVPWAGKTRTLRFRLSALAPGPGRIMVDFSQNGVPVGSVDLYPDVVGRRLPAAALRVLFGLLALFTTTGLTPGAGEGRSGGPGWAPLWFGLGALLSVGGLVLVWRLRERPPRRSARFKGERLLALSPVPLQAPDVVIKVFRLLLADKSGQLKYLLSSMHPDLQDLPVLDGDQGTTDPLGDLPGWVDRQLGLLAELADRQNATPEEVKRTLDDIGHRLYSEVVPAPFRDLYWTLRRRGVESVMILSDDPHVPWELIKPFRSDPLTGRLVDEDDCWGEAFALTHWLRGRPPPRQFALRHVIAVGMGGAAPAAGAAPAEEGAVSEELSALPSVEQELGALHLLPGARVQRMAPWCEKLYDVLEHGGFDLLHLAGHAAFGGSSSADASAVFLEDGPFSAGRLALRMEGALREAAPLVFFNACESGRTGFALVGIAGWSAGLLKLGCGAFLGALWRVTDQAALAFAREFYKRLAGGCELGRAVAEARRHIHALYPDDPSWLAYCCFGDPLARLALRE